MSDHFDHVEEAKMWLRNFEQNDPVAAAQVHATLALVEQQRIANLLQVNEDFMQVQMVHENQGEPARAAVWAEARKRLREEINSALGLRAFVNPDSSEDPA